MNCTNLVLKIVGEHKSLKFRGLCVFTLYPISISYVILLDKIVSSNLKSFALKVRKGYVNWVIKIKLVISTSICVPNPKPQR
jgi:hypothetical protein